MKMTIASLLLAGFSYTAAAQTDKVVAEVTNVDGIVKSIQLTESGELNVKRSDNTQQSERLSAVNAGRLIFEAHQLANVELATDHREFVCMMMVISPSLSVADGSQALTLILSPNTCAIHDYTHPKADGDQTIAKELKSDLIALAEQLSEY